MTSQSPSVPPPLPPVSTPVVQGDSTGGIIPYKNPQALTAYYLGVFSLIPLLGLLLGIGAVVLGIAGLRARKRQPVIRGSAHAWVGIILGGGVAVAHLLIATFVIFAALSQRSGD